jgi:hypothetical protein
VTAGVLWEERIENYVRKTGFPKSLFISEDGRVVGTWIMGNDYRVKSAFDSNQTPRRIWPIRPLIAISPTGFRRGGS